jgi:hypothetical protein
VQTLKYKSVSSVEGSNHDWLYPYSLWVAPLFLSEFAIEVSGVH